jgi:hypothetical protein
VCGQWQDSKESIAAPQWKTAKDFHDTDFSGEITLA